MEGAGLHHHQKNLASINWWKWSATYYTFLDKLHFNLWLLKTKYTLVIRDTASLYNRLLIGCSLLITTKPHGIQCTMHWLIGWMAPMFNWNVICYNIPLWMFISQSLVVPFLLQMWMPIVFMCCYPECLISRIHVFFIYFC